MAIMIKQWQKVVNIHRTYLLRYKEVKPAGCLPIVYTYHLSVVHVNKTVINEFKSYSILMSNEHPFDVTLFCVRKTAEFKRNFHIIRISIYCYICRY